MIECDVCGHLNYYGSETCAECGADLSDCTDWVDYDISEDEFF